MTTTEVDSADVIRLIEHHLTECGLHGACRALREESGVGAAATHSDLRMLCEAGRWGEVHESLSRLDPKRVSISASLMADVHEMTVLELAEIGEMDIAYATLRLASEALEAASVGTDSRRDWDRKSSIEKRVSSLSAMRKGQPATGTDLPPDYYGEDSISRQKRRDDVGRRLAEAVPSAPRARLVSLLQQAIKWQAHTGQLPMVEAPAGGGESDEDDDDEGEKSHKRRKRKKRRKKVVIDITLGEVPKSSLSSMKGTTTAGLGGTGTVGESRRVAERVPSREAGQIKFGKESYPECALFLPDGSGLVTGSSDGFVEIWDPKKWGRLRTHDLTYQKDDELMLHDSSVLSVAYSLDGEMLATGDSGGTVKVWRVQTGKCLREFERAHSKGICCVAFRRDASHVLTGSQDALCREFGLRASRMLKEFRGHASYVNTCRYLQDEHGSSSPLLVVTGSADGTCTVWDGKSAEALHVLRPDDGSIVGANIVSHTSAGDVGTGMSAGRNIHSVFALHTPAQTLLLVPHGPKAYLVSYTGTVLRIYTRDDVKGEGQDFVAASVSPSNKWLYCATENGQCVCFDVVKCDVQASFSLDSQGEVSGLAHHPHQGLIASFSNHKGTRGIVKLWK